MEQNVKTWKWRNGNQSNRKDGSLDSSLLQYWQMSFDFQVRAQSRDKQIEERMLAHRQDDNNRHATRHQVRLLSSNWKNLILWFPVTKTLTWSPFFTCRISYCAESWHSHLPSPICFSGGNLFYPFNERLEQLVRAEKWHRPVILQRRLEMFSGWSFLSALMCMTREFLQNCKLPFSSD